MGAIDRTRATATIDRVVGLLAGEQYETLARESAVGPSAKELQSSVLEYGEIVLASPWTISASGNRDDGSGWWVDVELFTVEGGRSDLTLSLALLDTGKTLYRVEIEDLHVL